MKTPGSATKPGHLYHEPAFKSDLPHQRGNADRWRILELHEDWRGKVVVDYGCNAGYFTFMTATHGAKLSHGFDIDREAIRFARQQAIDNSIRNVTFNDKDLANYYYHEELNPDVVLLLSVIPWIERTEPNPWTILRELMTAKTAYIELMYEGDGRAGMAGIKSDLEAKRWLQGHYKTAYPVGWTWPEHNGGIRRCLWRCSQEETPGRKEKADHVGSQAFVYLHERIVVKAGRSESRYQAPREVVALDRMKIDMVAPQPVFINPGENMIGMTRLQGATLASWGKIPPGGEDWFMAQAERICLAMEKRNVKHNDVRPENLWVGADGRLYLLDFGWATVDGVGEVPATINPEYRAANDRGSFEKIYERLCQK